MCDCGGDVVAARLSGGDLIIVWKREKVNIVIESGRVAVINT